MEEKPFASRIRERYPEGLTGILPIGGTRTAYILERNRSREDPGHIDSLAGYADHVRAQLFRLLGAYFDLGGQNLVAPILSYQLFDDARGQDYADFATEASFDLISAHWIKFYEDHQIDPYFAGIDTLLHFPRQERQYQLGIDLTRFHAGWPYQEGRRKLIWEMAPIPLFSIWRAHKVMGEQAQARLEAELESASNMQGLYDSLYRYYARAVYGTDIPNPHFYLGNNRNGDLKLRAMLPIALICGSPMRLFFVPYPTLLITPETLQALLEDLAFGGRLTSARTDYSGQITPDLIETEYQRVRELSSDPRSTLGMLRTAQLDDPSTLR